MSNSEEQQELIELVSKFFKAEISSDYLQQRLETPVVSDSKLWGKLLELGFFEYFEALSREDSPFSLLGEIARRAGAVPLPENLWESLLTGPFLFSVLAGDEDKESAKQLFGKEVFKGICQGTRSLIAAPLSSDAPLTVEEEGKELLVSGEVFGVPVKPDSVGCILVSGGEVYAARFPEAPPIGIETQATCLDRLIPRTVFTLERASSVRLSSVSSGEWSSLVRYLIASELLGVSEQAIDITRQHVTDRKQFGVSVGCFQAVRNPLADAYLKVRELEALQHFLSGMFERQDPQRHVLGLVILSAALSRAPQVVEKCVQLHGGIGFTWEYSLHLFLRRAKAYEAAFGLSKDEGQSMCSMSVEL